MSHDCQHNPPCASPPCERSQRPLLPAQVRGDAMTDLLVWTALDGAIALIRRELDIPSDGAARKLLIEACASSAVQSRNKDTATRLPPSWWRRDELNLDGPLTQMWT